MNKEYKIRNEEIERLVSVAVPDGSGQALTASTSQSIAVDFSQRTTNAKAFGLQLHILKMILKPAAGNIEYRISNIESGSYTLIEVSHSLFLISSLAATMLFNPANWRGQGGFINRKSELSADKFFNN
jgi:hypothetical protein